MTAREAEDTSKVSAWRSLVRLRAFLVPHWRAIGLALVLMTAEAAIDLLKPWPLKVTLDVILKRDALAGSTLSLLVAISLLIVALAVFEGLFAYLAALQLNRAGRTLVFELRSALFDHIHRLSLQFHNRRSTGDVMTRVTSDVNNLREALTESVAEIVKNVLFLVGMGAVLFWLDWKLSLILLAATPVLCVAMIRYGARVKERSRAERRPRDGPGIGGMALGISSAPMGAAHRERRGRPPVIEWAAGRLSARCYWSTIRRLVTCDPADSRAKYTPPVARVPASVAPSQLVTNVPAAAS